MSDAGMIHAGKRIIARGQPNAVETGDRADSGSEPHSGGTSSEGGFHGYDAHHYAMKAHAGFMAAHNAYMQDAGRGGAMGEVHRAAQDHMHSTTEQGEMGQMHSDTEQVGSPRQAFSGARSQGQLGQMKHVPLP